MLVASYLQKKSFTIEVYNFSSVACPYKTWFLYLKSNFLLADRKLARTSSCMAAVSHRLGWCALSLSLIFMKLNLDGAEIMLHQYIVIGSRGCWRELGLPNNIINSSRFVVIQDLRKHIIDIVHCKRKKTHWKDSDHPSKLTDMIYYQSTPRIQFRSSTIPLQYNILSAPIESFFLAVKTLKE